MAVLFKKLKIVESKIDSYLDLVVKGGFLFKQGIRYYFDGQSEEFEKRLASLDRTEGSADILRREIENTLYTETLIPEAREDVLRLLESSDDVLNITNETVRQFSIENPYIIPEVKPFFIELTDASVSALEMMVTAVRAYFRDTTNVRDYINKVQLYETETDKIGEKIMRTVFNSDIDLCQKFHIRYFVLNIENIADLAEDVCDRLSIAVIKRFT